MVAKLYRTVPCKSVGGSHAKSRPSPVCVKNCMSIARLQPKVPSQSCTFVQSTAPLPVKGFHRRLRGVRCRYLRHGRLSDELGNLQADLLARDSSGPSSRQTSRSARSTQSAQQSKPASLYPPALRNTSSSSGNGSSSLSTTSSHDVRVRYELPLDTCSDNVCQLDMECDPVDTLQQLRQCLFLHGTATLVVSDSRPDLLLDAVSLLHLLNQDLRLDQDFSTVILFQPMLPHFSQPPSSSIALHVVKLQAPGLLQQLPSCVMAHASSAKPGAPSSASSPIPRSSTMPEVWNIADRLVERLDAHVMTQLRCMGPRSLVVAFRAIQRARKLLQMAGDGDVLVSPHIITEKSKSMVCFNCWRADGGSRRDQVQGIELI